MYISSKAGVGLMISSGKGTSTLDTADVLVRVHDYIHTQGLKTLEIRKQRLRFRCAEVQYIRPTVDKRGAPFGTESTVSVGRVMIGVAHFDEKGTVRKLAIPAFPWCPFRQNPIRSDRLNTPLQ